MNIGHRIKERRIEMGLSAEKLGEIIGKNRATIYRYENGDIENMPLDILEPIAKALHTTPAYLMGWNVETIESISNMQNDANEFDDKHESELKEIFIELEEMDITHNEIKMLKRLAKYFSEINIEYLKIYYKLYELNLTEDELQDLYEYAEFVKSKR